MIFQYDKCRITRVYSPKAINVKTADDRKRTRQRQASAYSDGRWSRQEPAGTSITQSQGVQNMQRNYRRNADLNWQNFWEIPIAFNIFAEIAAVLNAIWKLRHN